MTAFTRAFLRCDTDGCTTTWGDTTTPHRRTEGQARTGAQRDGWRFTRDGRDVCPDHAPGRTDRP